MQNYCAHDTRGKHTRTRVADPSGGEKRHLTSTPNLTSIYGHPASPIRARRVNVIKFKYFCNVKINRRGAVLTREKSYEK